MGVGWKPPGLSVSVIVPQARVESNLGLETLEVAERALEDSRHSDSQSASHSVRHLPLCGLDGVGRDGAGNGIVQNSPVRP